MPSVSPKQARFMQGIVHGMKASSGKGPSKAVAKEFVRADAGKMESLKGKANMPTRSR
jgi:hypothetical protein